MITHSLLKPTQIPVCHKNIATTNRALNNPSFLSEQKGIRSPLSALHMGQALFEEIMQKYRTTKLNYLGLLTLEFYEQAGIFESSPSWSQYLINMQFFVERSLSTFSSFYSKREHLMSPKVVLGMEKNVQLMEFQIKLQKQFHFIDRFQQSQVGSPDLQFVIQSQANEGRDVHANRFFQHLEIFKEYTRMFNETRQSVLSDSLFINTNGMNQNLRSFSSVEWMKPVERLQLFSEKQLHETSFLLVGIPLTAWQPEIVIRSKEKWLRVRDSIVSEIQASNEQTKKSSTGLGFSSSGSEFTYFHLYPTPLDKDRGKLNIRIPSLNAWTLNEKRQFQAVKWMNYVERLQLFSKNELPETSFSLANIPLTIWHSEFVMKSEEKWLRVRSSLVSKIQKSYEQPEKLSTGLEFPSSKREFAYFHSYLMRLDKGRGKQSIPIPSPNVWTLDEKRPFQAQEITLKNQQEKNFQQYFSRLWPVNRSLLTMNSVLKGDQFKQSFQLDNRGPFILETYLSHPWTHLFSYSQSNRKEEIDPENPFQHQVHERSLTMQFSLSKVLQHTFQKLFRSTHTSKHSSGKTEDEGLLWGDKQWWVKQQNMWVENLEKHHLYPLKHSLSILQESKEKKFYEKQSFHFAYDRWMAKQFSPLVSYPLAQLFKYLNQPLLSTLQLKEYEQRSEIESNDSRKSSQFRNPFFVELLFSKTDRRISTKSAPFKLGRIHIAPDRLNANTNELFELRNAPLAQRDWKLLDFILMESKLEKMKFSFEKVSIIRDAIQRIDRAKSMSTWIYSQQEKFSISNLFSGIKGFWDSNSNKNRALYGVTPVHLQEEKEQQGTKFLNRMGILDEQVLINLFSKNQIDLRQWNSKEVSIRRMDRNGLIAREEASKNWLRNGLEFLSNHETWLPINRAIRVLTVDFDEVGKEFGPLSKEMKQRIFSNLELIQHLRKTGTIDEVTTTKKQTSPIAYSRPNLQYHQPYREQRERKPNQPAVLPMQSSELNVQQKINETNQIQSLNIDGLVDKVYREFQNRLNFDRQRQGF